MAESDYERPNEVMITHKTPQNGTVNLILQNADQLLRLIYIFNSVTNGRNGHIDCILSYSFDIGNGHEVQKETKITYEFLREVSSYSSDGHFTLKVPMFLMPYTLHCKVILELKGTANPDTFRSEDKSIEIPSIMMDPGYSVGDTVSYTVPNSTYSSTGIIRKISDDGMVTLQALRPEDRSNGRRLVIVEYDRLFVRIPNMTTIDLTNRLEAVSDLVLNTDNPMQIAILNALSDAIYSEWIDESKYILFGKYEFQFIGEWMAMEIQSFLEVRTHQYRIGCPFDGYKLSASQQWKYSVNRTYCAYKNGMDAVDPQQQWNCSGYTCDVCNVEQSYFQTMYRSECPSIADSRDFCVSCIHDIVRQHRELHAFLKDILHEDLVENCIGEIVTFCVGQVLKFAV